VSSAELERRLAGRAVAIVACFRLAETLASDGIVYFPSQYAVELARHAPVWWVNPPARRPRRPRRVHGVAELDLVGRSEPIGFYGGIEWRQLRGYLRGIRRKTPDRELLVLTFSTVLPAPEPHGAVRRVGFVGDDFLPLDHPYLAECDLLVCSSRLHAEQIAQRDDLPPALQLSMGVGTPFLERAAGARSSGRLRGLFDDPARPLAAYFGTLRRADVGLLAEVARLRPDVNFLCAGTLGDEDDAAVAAQLRRPNVRFVPRYRNDEMPALLADVDVGLIAYAVDDFNRGSSPTKLFEYFALGLPVVSTPLPYPAAEAALLRSAATAEEFAAELDGALAAAADGRDARIALARCSTPPQRLLTILRALDG
jgi:glycosyltransferase involved in cell wall biosynthesis